MTNEELILLKSEMENLKNTVSEMKKEIKDHNVFSTQIALLNQTVAELSKVVKEVIIAMHICFIDFIYSCFELVNIISVNNFIVSACFLHNSSTIPHPDFEL